MAEQHPFGDGVPAAAAGMHGDLVALVLDELGAARTTWALLRDDEQRAIVERVRRRVGEAIEQCVRTIASQGFVRIAAKVDSITVKDGIKAQLSLSARDAARHAFLDAQGATVYVVLVKALDASEPNHGDLVLGALDRIGKQTKPGATRE